MKLFCSVGILGSFVLMGLVGCSGAASDASRGTNNNTNNNTDTANTAPVARSVALTANTTPATVGTQLTASYIYFDADGDTQGSSVIRWLSNGVAITSTEGLLSYTLVSADVGKTIVVEVTPKAVSGVLSGSATLSNSIAINNSVPTANNVVVTPSTARVNTLLTASFLYNDVDNDPKGASVYEWSNGTDVVGTGATYTVAVADAHKTLSVKVTPVASSGTSPGVAATSTGLAVDNSPPSITGLAIGSNVTGKAYTGVELNANYSFQDPDSDGEGATTYQWLRDGAPIGGATALRYTVTSADIGVPLTVRVTPKDNFVSALSGASVTSSAITPVNLAPVASNVRIIDAAGSTPAQHILAAVYDYADHEGDLAGTPLYVWKRNGVPVASSTIYDLGLSDAGSAISVEITPVALSGTLSGMATAATAALNVPSASIALNVSAGLKQLHFSWAAVTSATRYRVLFNPDGVSGYAPLSAASDNLNVTNYDWDISVHRINWPKAQFILEACDLKNTCLPSANVSALNVMVSTIGYFKASNAGANDQFGYSVALSADGNTLAVGAPYEDSAATGINNISPGQGDNTSVDSGAVYVYTRILGIWTQEAYVKASHSRATSYFGWSVALNSVGNTLAVGAWAENATYVYTRNAGVWTEQAFLKDPTPKSFGMSVALSHSGDTLAIGAKDDGTAATGVNNGSPVSDCGTAVPTNCAAYSGAVYVYTRSVGTWTQQSYVKASNTAKDNSAQEHFGSVLALSGDGKTLAVGAGQEGGAAIGGSDVHDCSAVPPINCAKNSGAVYVFTLGTAGNWTQQAYVKASNIGAGDNFGGTVALTGDGNTLVVGANFEGSAATGINGNEVHDCAAAPPINCNNFSGAVYLYARSSGMWTKQTYIKPNYPQSPFFPTSISISTDGNTLVIGNLNDYSSSSGAGAVYVYTHSGNVWMPPSRIYSSNPGANDHFGNSVSLSGDGSTLAVGANQESSSATGVNNTMLGQGDNSSPSAGAAYLY